MVVEVLKTGMQAEKFLRAFSPLESLLLSLLTPCGTVGLLDQVVTSGCRDHLLVVNMIERRKFPDRGSIGPKLIGVNDLWNVIFTQESDQEGPRSVGISVPLKENIDHKAMLVYSPPEPVTNAIDTGAHFIEVPPGTPPGFSVAQFFREEGSKLYAPLAQRLVEEWRPHRRPFTTILTSMPRWWSNS